MCTYHFIQCGSWLEGWVHWTSANETCWFYNNSYNSLCQVPAVERNNVQWNTLAPGPGSPNVEGDVETLPLTCFCVILCQGMPLRSVAEIVKLPELPSSIMAPKLMAKWREWKLRACIACLDSCVSLNRDCFFRWSAWFPIHGCVVLY